MLLLNFASVWFFPFTRSMFSCYFCGFMVLIVVLAKVGNFFYFVLWKFQTVFRWKPCFRKALFCAFCWFLGVLKLHLHVGALPASMIMSWPAKTASKLNMSGLDFVAPVLQSSNSFDHKLFFKFCLVYCICEFEFFDSYKSNNVFFALPFIFLMLNFIVFPF